ncbi:hypothetical protein BO70DRAFT_357893 [Aspergillus heteromorphus CBS 117.55]|uniref:Uncharacterized protein n=1 Tax=Aspergillus heteromorphus CBS 117.55 TaxID=1448321 RepID=A0A317X3L8_9EURO|nr:uncharacterized protein BO70DRAFT_357893 [Aspergillus heteromorphus CBS 117.55]PWY92751.1 hypothetical protein BO70DRAFT_357893 [Aspergillus heteromorphus CBS 117.55]
MASRRSAEKTPPKEVAAPSSSGKKVSDSDVTPAVPTNVIMKLAFFSVAMIFVPIGMYFVTVNVGGTSATVGGIVAAIMANVVLVAYIFVAWKDDQAEREAEQKQKEKKAQ